MTTLKKGSHCLPLIQHPVQATRDFLIAAQQGFLPFSEGGRFPALSILCYIAHHFTISYSTHLALSVTTVISE